MQIFTVELWFSYEFSDENQFTYQERKLQQNKNI